MSDSPQASERQWHFYIADMIGFAEKVEHYTTGLDQARFIADHRTYDATLSNLELIGEAAGHIPDAVRQAHPDVPWRVIVATRNRLIHGYLGMDDETLWSVVKDDVPVLIAALRRMAGNTGDGVPA